MITFKNKNVLITGATGGIGNELVKKFITFAARALHTLKLGYHGRHANSQNIVTVVD